jgi:endonuclease/exonuclease/phosphatase family metal-dependent hydrolase
MLMVRFMCADLTEGTHSTSAARKVRAAPAAELSAVVFDGDVDEDAAWEEMVEMFSELRRRRRAFALLVFVLSVALEGAAAEPLTIMSFNIRYGTANDGPNRWESRRGQLIDLVDAQNPDVVGVQEALHFQIDEMLAALPEYRMVGVGRSDGGQSGEYSAILYRTSRLTPRRTETFWFSETPAVIASNTWGNAIERICTWALFDDRHGRSFYAFNVHLDHISQPSREKSVGLLLERIKVRAPAAPVVVTGDFNTGETNPATRAMLSMFRDTFRVMHPKATEVGTANAFKFGQTTGERRSIGDILPITFR